MIYMKKNIQPSEKNIISCRPNRQLVDKFQSERRLILKNYYTIYRAVSYNKSARNRVWIKLMKKAFRIIMDAYRPGMKEEKYKLLVSIEIASIVAEKFQLGAQPIICILLKYAIKKKKISKIEVKKEFGEAIADIVTALLRADVTNQQRGPLFHLKHVLKYFSPEHLIVVVIKLAEHLHKMYLIDKLSQKEQLALLELSKRVYIALAHNMGIDSVYLELEDLYLNFKHPIVYDTILKKIKASKATKRGFLERFAKKICHLVDPEKKMIRIKGRTKSISSISHKVQVRNIPFDSIYDFYAIRIVFDCQPGQEYGFCWTIYESIVTHYEPKVTYLRDWVSYPTATGYEALHISVKAQEEDQWIEVQIRAKDMDDNAELGDAAHWKYKCSKLGKEFEKMDKTWLDKARKFLNAQKFKNIDGNIFITVGHAYIQEE